LKVAIIRFSSLGDIILTTAVIEALYENNIKASFITFSNFKTLFEKDYRLSDVITVDKQQLKSIKDIKYFSKTLSNYDLILDLHSNFRSFLISYFSGIKTLRYDKKSIQRRFLLSPLTKKFVKLDNFSVINAYLEPLKRLGIKNIGKYRPKIIISDDDKPDVKLPDKFIAVGTGARYKGKMYPYYEKVIKLLKNQGFQIVLVGSKEDVEKDGNKYESVIDLRGRLSIRETLYVLSKAILTISNDSAVAHMSRAVKTKVLMIYGATHPYFGFYPFKDEGDFLFANLDCQPCDLHGKKECKFKDYRCFKEIKPSTVVEKALSLL
jgi:ADP-heptose:LPS heptosyltransferase